jgi:hypothetical protein
LLGSLLSASAPDIAIRPVLVFVLVASALKLLGVSNVELLVGLIAAAVTLPSVWALIDVARWKPQDWAKVQPGKETWIRILAVGIVLFGVGLLASIAYFVSIRPRLVAAAGEEARVAM